MSGGGSDDQHARSGTSDASRGDVLCESGRVLLGELSGSVCAERNGKRPPLHHKNSVNWEETAVEVGVERG